jgi:hypothetical protein
MVGRVTPNWAAISATVYLERPSGVSSSYMARASLTCRRYGGAGSFETVTGAFAHQGMFQLGDGPEDLEEHPPDRGAFDALEDDQVDATAVKILGQFDEVLEGTPEPVEFGDDQLVAGSGDEEGLVEFGPASELPGGLVDMDLARSRRPAARRAGRRGSGHG